jgi:hypothetical protein
MGKLGESITNRTKVALFVGIAIIFGFIIMNGAICVPTKDQVYNNILTQICIIFNQLGSILYSLST